MDVYKQTRADLGLEDGLQEHDRGRVPGGSVAVCHVNAEQASSLQIALWGYPIRETKL